MTINGDNISANVNNKIDINNPANLADGTSGTPSLAFTNDSDTGIYRPTSNSIGLSTSGVERVRIEENGGMSSVIPGGSTLLPSFACRAWVNFDGTTAANLTGTYSQSGTTVTVTINNHGLLLGHSVSVDVTTGTGVDGVYTVTGVTDVNTFTYTAGTSLTTSGNITLLRRLIRGSGNVSSVMRNAVGDYTVNFTIAMPDANYAIFSTAHQDAVDASFMCITVISRTTSLFRTRYGHYEGGTFNLRDCDYVGSGVFR